MAHFLPQKVMIKLDKTIKTIISETFTQENLSLGIWRFSLQHPPPLPPPPLQFYQRGAGCAGLQPPCWRGSKGSWEMWEKHMLGVLETKSISVAIGEDPRFASLRRRRALWSPTEGQDRTLTQGSGDEKIVSGPPTHPRMGWDVRLRAYNPAIPRLGTYPRRMGNTGPHTDLKANVTAALS